MLRAFYIITEDSDLVYRVPNQRLIADNPLTVKNYWSMMLEESEQRLAKDLIDDTLMAFRDADEELAAMHDLERDRSRKAKFIALVCLIIAATTLVVIWFVS